MAKPSTGNYFYINKNGMVIQDSHPGRDKKTGALKAPIGVKDVRCWTELNQDQQLWFYPDGSTKTGCVADQDAKIPFEEDDEFVSLTKMGPYERHCMFIVVNIPDLPFWRYAMDEEWKSAWRNEWANRVAESHGEWWKNEIKAFLSIVKELSEKGTELGDITKETLVIIKERFSKKKEASHE